MERKKLRSLPQLWHTFTSLKGNPKACLWTEPLWGIPSHLYAPFVSVYMAALGLSPGHIGTVTTVVLLSQMFWAFMSGFLTDKLGRRTCTIIFDFLAWSVPTLLWAFAQNYTWFVVAALFNGMWRVTENSWALLLVEDEPDEKLVSLYSICYIAGLLSGFVAPATYFFVQKYALVPTMRGLYFLAFIMMSLKFIILFAMSKETKVGEKRKAEWKNKPMGAYFKKSFHMFWEIIKTPRMLAVIGLVATFSALQNISKDFWSLLVTAKLGIGEENLSLFFTIKSFAMLFMYLFVVPNVRVDRFLKPMVIGFGIYALSQVFVLNATTGSYALVVLSILAEGIALTLLQPLVNSLLMVNADKEERARVVGLLFASCLLITAPFGAISGALSDANRAYPMVLNCALVTIGIALTFTLSKKPIVEEK